MATLASGWPTETEIEARTNIALTSGSHVYSSAAGINVSDILTRAFWHVAEYCRRDVHGTTRLGFDEADVSNEIHDGGCIIAVRHPPIISVSTLEWDDSELSESDEDFYVYEHYVYIVQADEAGLEQRDPYRPHVYPRYVDISYTGGFSDGATGTHVAIPHELKECVLEVACRWLLRTEQRYRVDKGAARTSVGEATATYVPDAELLAGVYARLDRLDRTINLRAM